MENSNLISTLSESEERNWAIFSHLGILGGMFIPFGNILMPLLIWQLNKDKSAFVTDHAIEALNFQLTMLITTIGLGILCIILIGIPLLIIAVILYIVFSIIAATKASDGKYYDYPFNFRFIK